MIFGKKREGGEVGPGPGVQAPPAPGEMVLVMGPAADADELAEACVDVFGGPVRIVSPEKVSVTELKNAKHAVAVFQPNEVLTKLLETLAVHREAQETGFPTLIIVQRPY